MKQICNSHHIRLLRAAIVMLASVLLFLTAAGVFLPVAAVSDGGISPGQSGEILIPAGDASLPVAFTGVSARAALLMEAESGDVVFGQNENARLPMASTTKIMTALVALESLAEPGAFLYVSGPVLALRPYEHTEAFRWGTLFRLLGRCLPCLTLPAISPPHPSHCP